MAITMSKWVLELPGGLEYYAESFGMLSTEDTLKLCVNALRAKGITTSRKEPTEVIVTVFALDIFEGELNRIRLDSYKVMPPLAPMTALEFAEALTATYADLPEEFQSFVCARAYAAGHSGGYDEILTITRNLVAELRPHVDRYTARITSK